MQLATEAELVNCSIPIYAELCSTVDVAKWFLQLDRVKIKNVFINDLDQKHGPHCANKSTK